MNCTNCGAHIYAKGLCRPCYAYKLRTGTERPEELIVAHNRRRFDRAQIRAHFLACSIAYEPNVVNSAH